MASLYQLGKDVSVYDVSYITSKHPVTVSRVVAMGRAIGHSLHILELAVIWEYMVWQN